MSGRSKSIVVSVHSERRGRRTLTCRPPNTNQQSPLNLHSNENQPYNSLSKVAFQIQVPKFYGVVTPLAKTSEFSVVKMNEDNTVSDDLKRQAAMFYNSTQRLVYYVYCENMAIV